MLKSVVIDDEPLARSRIIELLLDDQEIMVVGEARTGYEANRLIKNKKPDLVFLDIQMPDYDGFSVLSKLSSESQPVIIFVTAYDRFAIRAFETNAIDYLLKPYDNQRFHKALDNAKQQIKLRQFSKLSEGLLDLVKTYQWEQESHPQTIPLKHHGITEKIPIDQILVIESQGNYVKLILSNRWFLYRNTISHLAAKFQSFEFLRIHRSVLINTKYVKKVCYLQNNEYRFCMANDTKYNSGRSYKNAIEVFVLNRQSGS
jgi:two-component system LytT family response regulator